MKKPGPDLSRSDELMTVKELAGYLKIHVSTLYRMVRGKKIPVFKVGSDYRFSRASIDEWISSAHRRA